MQKQEISNIMIFFVTQDLEGQPRQLEMHLMPEKEVSMMNQRFTEYLQRQREMYKPSLVQSHLPDLYLCRYQFPAGVSYPDIRLFDKDNSLVQKFITRNGGSMQGNVSLRGLEYLHSHDEEKSLPMLVASGLADHLLVQPEAKRFALAQDTLHDDPSETLTAVETAKGVLLFEYSGFGKTCCHAYMQHLADRFFITDEEKPGVCQPVQADPSGRRSGKGIPSISQCLLLIYKLFSAGESTISGCDYPAECPAGQEPPHRTDIRCL